MIERRLILQMLCALGAEAVVVPAVASSDAARSLAEGIDTEAIHRLAAQFRAAYPTAAELKSVRDLLDDLATDPDRLLRRLRESMHADYREARFVRLSGWFVSRTEAALVATLSDALG
jgi:hypothetical protein